MVRLRIGAILRHLLPLYGKEKPEASGDNTSRMILYSPQSLDNAGAERIRLLQYRGKKKLNVRASPSGKTETLSVMMLTLFITPA